jgi:hypothetical protein
MLALKRYNDSVLIQRIIEETSVLRSSVYKLRAKTVSQGWREGDIVLSKRRENYQSAQSESLHDLSEAMGSSSQDRQGTDKIRVDPLYNLSEALLSPTPDPPVDRTLKRGCHTERSLELRP